jgi:phosphoribosylformimino-5-aminoimidazole carboxamide ribotide isomerase
VILYPAIDLKSGQCVRLLRGEMSAATVYNEDPAAQARSFVAAGCRWLHVVDLDGAFAGKPMNAAAVAAIVAAARVPVQLGGGIRDRATIERWLEQGVTRVVLGTAALRDPQLLEGMIEAQGDHLLVSVDARDGKVALSGWTQTSQLDVAEAVAQLSERGVSRFLCTAIEVDGTMEGPALELLNRIAARTEAEVLASGGVGELSHLEQLAAQASPNITGVIVGRALYERKFTVAEATAALT